MLRYLAKNSDSLNIPSIESVFNEIPCNLSDYSYIDFSNFLKNAYVERLAEADHYELVKDIRVSFDKIRPFNSLLGVLCRLSSCWA